MQKERRAPSLVLLLVPLMKPGVAMSLVPRLRLPILPGLERREKVNHLVAVGPRYLLRMHDRDLRLRIGRSYLDGGDRVLPLLDAGDVDYAAEPPHNDLVGNVLDQIVQWQPKHVSDASPYLLRGAHHLFMLLLCPTSGAI